MRKQAVDGNQLMGSVWMLNTVLQNWLGADLRLRCVCGRVRPRALLSAWPDEGAAWMDAAAQQGEQMAGCGMGCGETVQGLVQYSG